MHEFASPTDRSHEHNGMVTTLEVHMGVTYGRTEIPHFKAGVDLDGKKKLLK